MSVRQRQIVLDQNVDRRAAGDMDGVRPLAHAQEKFAGALGRREMNMGELGDGVAHILVDRAGHLAALRVSHRDIHVARGDGGGDGFEPVGDGQHHVGLQRLEMRGKLDGAETDRLGHGDRSFAVDDGMHDRLRLKPISADDVDGRAEPIKQRGGSDDELKLEVRVIASRRARSS